MAYVLIILFLYGFFIAQNSPWMRGLIFYLRVSEKDAVSIKREYTTGETDTETLIVLSKKWDGIHLASDIRGTAVWSFDSLGEMLASSPSPYRHLTKSTYKVCKPKKDS